MRIHAIENLTTVGADTLRALVVGLLTGLLTWLAIDFARPAATGVTVIWAASGVLAGILLTSPYRLWTIYLCAGFVANIAGRALGGDALPMVAGRGFASTLETCIVVYALRLFVGDVTDPVNLALVSRVAISSTLVAGVISAFIAAATTSLFGSAPFATTYFAWFASHTLGMVIFATPVGIARQLGMSLFGRPGRRWKFARTITLVAATTVLVFSQTRYPLLFLIYPPLLLAVFRHRFAGWAVGITVVAIISVALTQHGTGPIGMVAAATSKSTTLLLQVFIAITCLTTLPVAIVLTERGYLAAELRKSERNYRVLADHSRDMVVRMRADGRRLYQSPSVSEILGWPSSELVEPRWDLVHPDDRAMLIDAIGTLLASGNPATVEYRILHKDDHYVWIEAIAQRVPGEKTDDTAEIVYAGRDISKRKAAQRALAESEQRLRAIADNLPAMVVQVDAEQKYTFVNATFCKVFGFEPAEVLGRSIHETVDAEFYESVRPQIEAALRGERQTFEAGIEINGRYIYRLVNYIPNIAADGSVHGFYSMSYDITELQAAKQELARLAQHDSLTGLANRNKFNERLDLALERCHRHHRAIALIYLDIDFFKRINDSYGHVAGDALLREFAARLQHNLRATDLAARLGGDEFAVLVEDADSVAVPETIARKLCAAMRPGCMVDGVEIFFSASIGVAFCHTPPTAKGLLQLADTALYQAKAAGRDTFRALAVD